MDYEKYFTRFKEEIKADLYRRERDAFWEINSEVRNIQQNPDKRDCIIETYCNKED